MLLIVAVVGTVVLVYRVPQYGVAVLLAGFLASRDVVLLASPRTFEAGNLSFEPTDIALVLVLVAYLLRRATGHADEMRLPKPLLFLLALLIIHTARGFEAYGLQATISSERRLIWFAGAAIYAASVPWTKRLDNVFIAATCALLSVALYKFATTGVHSAGRATFVDGEWLPLRPLNAAGALLLLQLLLVIWFLPLSRRLVPRVLVGIGLPVLVLVQQRTVLAAGMLIAPFLWVAWLRRVDYVSRESGYAIVGGTLIVSPVIVWLLIQSQSLLSSLESAVGSGSTLEWRVAGWQAMLGLMSPSDWLMGTPAGEPQGRYVLGEFTSVQAHNVYVELLFRFGILGVVALGALIVFVARRAKAEGSLPVPRWVGYALIASTLVFGMSYMLGLESGLWIGLLAASQHPSEAARRTPMPNSADSQSRARACSEAPVTA
jgi:hypothetical protein